MPVYEYRCKYCMHNFDELLTFSGAKEPQECPQCESLDTERIISKPQVIFKGDGWADKNAKIKKQMARKNSRLDRKQNEMKRDAPSVTLAPNVDGERVDTWSEASKLAKSKGKDTQGYDKKAREEIAKDKKQ